MPRSALLCVLLAGALAATAVAGTRAGLALAGALLLVLAAGELSGTARRSSRSFLALAAALAVQPVLRDADWVVDAAVAAALLGGAAAVAPPGTWPGVARAAAAPWRLVAGGAVVGRALRGLLPEAPGRSARPVLRGLALAGVLTGGFGGLFVAADSAFAELAGDALAIDADPFELTWRAVLGLAFAAAAGALVRASRPPVHGPPTAPRVPGRLELRIGLGALAALFATFVAVQLRVLFGGAGYVEATTGLGYGEYARQGFVALLAVTAGTLAVVALAARARDGAVRALLGLLCVLSFVVLASAHHRLVLVEDAYGFTRPRYGRHAVVLWLGAILALVLAAGARRAVARAAPRIAVGVTLAGALAFSLADPDRRIAERAVERFEERGRIDPAYMSRLSADALPALERLPEGPERREILDGVRSELRRRDTRDGARVLREPDGLAGLNLSRRRAR